MATTKKKEISLQQPEKLVVKSNTLIQKARFNLTLQERRILAILISRINPFDSEFKPIEIKMSDIFRLCNMDPDAGKNYQDIRKAIKNIADKSVWVKIGSRETLLRWIEKPDIEQGRDFIRVRFDEDMKPFLLDLRKNFTKYNLDFALQFNSVYSHGLYEYIQSVHYHTLEPLTITVDLEELKTIIGARSYKEYSDFRKRALDPAIEEINKYTEKTVSYEPVKSGKAVTALTFTISSKNSMDVLVIRAKQERDFGWSSTPNLDTLKNVWVAFGETGCSSGEYEQLAIELIGDE